MQQIRSTIHTYRTKLRKFKGRDVDVKRLEIGMMEGGGGKYLMILNRIK